MRKVAFSSAALIIALSFVRVTFALMVHASQQALDLASPDKTTVSNHNGSSLSAELPNAPPNSVDITGRSTGYSDVGYEFIATVRPKSTTRPVTFTWQVSDLGSFTRIVTDSLYDARTFTWATPGNKIITVVADNGEKTVDDVQVITIQPQPLDDCSIECSQGGTINNAYNFLTNCSPPKSYKPTT